MPRTRTHIIVGWTALTDDLPVPPRIVVHVNDRVCPRVRHGRHEVIVRGEKGRVEGGGRGVGRGPDEILPAHGEADAVE